MNGPRFPGFRLLHLGAVTLTATVWATSAVAFRGQSGPAADQWRQWGGANRNFIVEGKGLAEKWPEGGPPVLWSRPLGTGHSAILYDEGRLYTMFRVGNGRGGGGRSQGPWDAEETVIALDAKTGKTRLGAQVRLAPRGLQLWRRPALDAAHRRRSALHHRHQPADVRLRQAHGQDPLVARLHQGVQLARAADPPGGEDRLWLQSDRVSRHHDLQRRRTRAVGDGLPSERRRRRVEERRFPDLGGGAHPDRLRRFAAARVPRRRHSHRIGSGQRTSACGRTRTIQATTSTARTPIWGSDNILFVSSAYKAGQPRDSAEAAR